MNSDVQVNYDALEMVERKFREQADALAYIRRKLQYRFDLLIPHGWEGDSARAFEGEMINHVLPTLHRLVDALEEARYTTRKISDVMERAEAEATEQFVIRR